MTRNTPEKNNELMMRDTKEYIIPFLINENRDLQFTFFYNDSTEKLTWFVTVYFNFQTGLFTFEPILFGYSRFKKTISENHIKQEFIALFKSLHLEVVFKKTKTDMKKN